MARAGRARDDRRATRRAASIASKACSPRAASPAFTIVAGQLSHSFARPRTASRSSPRPTSSASAPTARARRRSARRTRCSAASPTGASSRPATTSSTRSTASAATRASDRRHGSILGPPRSRERAKLEIDALQLEYDGGTLYLPVYRLGEVQRYVGAEGHAPRDRQARRHHVGIDDAARSSATSARSPRSCSRSTRSARRCPATASRRPTISSASSRRRSRSTRRPTSRRRSTPCSATWRPPQRDGPPRLRRRRLRQDRGRDARDLQGACRAASRRACSRRPPCSSSSTSARSTDRFKGFGVRARQADALPVEEGAGRRP